MTARAAVIAEAKRWLGTPFIGGACRRGVGCDCGSFLAAVYAETGVIEPLALGKYDWAAPWGRGDTFYVEHIERHAFQIDQSLALPADLVLYHQGRGWSHAGIVADWPRAIIHCCRQSGVTMQSGLAGRMGRWGRRFYRMRALADA